MELTGKCRIAFEKWYNIKYPNELVYSTMNETLFNSIPNSMQYGVYVDFFDSTGVTILINYIKEYNTFSYGIYWRDQTFYQGTVDRSHTRVEAIKQANKIYNEEN